MNNKDIRKFAKAQGYEQIYYVGKWRGYDVYKPLFEEETTVGLPLAIMARGQQIRMSTPEEAFKIIDDLEE